MAIIKSFSERPAEAKETPYTPLYKKIKIKFVRYRKVLGPPQRREKEKYISYNVPRVYDVFAIAKRRRKCGEARSDQGERSIYALLYEVPCLIIF